MRYRRGRPKGRTAATCVNSQCHDRCSRLVKSLPLYSDRAVMKSRNGPHKAPFIGELAAKGGLRG